MIDQGEFLDDFSDPRLARYYEIVPGVGGITRTATGLHCVLARALDGAASADDQLAIDTLGRPHSPTTRAVLRFIGEDWLLELAVEYDFEEKANGRHAYVWVVPGDPKTRTVESIAIVRSADLAPESHCLTIQVRRRDEAMQTVVVSQAPQRRWWFRVARTRGRLTVASSPDGVAFGTAVEMAVWPAGATHCVVVNSSSFAGGAAFLLHELRLRGAAVQDAPHPRRVYSGPPGAHNEVLEEALLRALGSDEDLDVRDCVVRGGLDLRRLEGPIRSAARFRGCTFAGPVIGSGDVQTSRPMSWEECRFDQVGLSSVTFGGPVAFVGCEFSGDARFIETRFKHGANFSGSRFREKPFFRSARVDGSLSLYHTSFAHGPDLSSMDVTGDLSLSDMAVDAGSLTLHRSRVNGTVRLMTTLQREPQRLGNEVDCSSATLGGLVISSGDRGNESEYTGPARWDFPARMSLHGAAIDRLEAYRVHFAEPFDLSSSTLRSVELEQATFDQPIGEWPVWTEFYSCFISYSSQDHEFAGKLRDALQRQGVPCWFAPEDMKIGDLIRQRIEDEIRRHDKLLLILSKDSVQSDWVRDEVEACLERERQQRRQLLFPIQLDDAIQRTRQGWAALIRRQRHMGDFRAWRDEHAYAAALQRLLRDLRAPQARQAGPPPHEPPSKGFRRVYFENFAAPASVSPDIWLMGARGPWSGGVAKHRYSLRNKSGAETAAYTSIFTYEEAGTPVDQAHAKVAMTVQLDGALSKHAAAGILYRASRMPDRFYAFALSVGGTLSWFEGEEGRVQVLRTWELGGHSDGQPARLQIESSPDAIHLYVGNRLFHRIDGAARAQGNPGVFAMGRGRFLFSEISVYLPTE